jgi:hypothetical protein
MPRIPELDLVEWAQQHNAWLEYVLFRHGAVLFRNFDRLSAAAFERFALSLCPDLFGDYGDLPRESFGDRIYSSTPYPSGDCILFHNESSHLRRWPMKIWFFCAQPSATGGETPIVDCRRICAHLRPTVLARFATKKLMYVRNFTPGFDVSWQAFFGTSNRSEVEAKCRRDGVSVTWTAAGLRTRQVRDAVLTHPKTGETVFFNQVQLHHPSCLTPSVRTALDTLLRSEDYPRNVYYGDGTPIEDEIVAEVNQAYASLEVKFQWQKHDILMVDNVLVAHGRKPFTGSRKILVAMSELYEARSGGK